MLLLAAACGRDATTAQQAAPPPAPVAAPPAGAPSDPSPCTRIDERQRAAITSLGADAAGLPNVFRRCAFVAGGAIGLVPERIASETTRAYRLVFEPGQGVALVSERRDYELTPRGETAADPPLETLAFPATNGNAAPVTFVKFRSRVEPVPLAISLPIQTEAFFAPLSKLLLGKTPGATARGTFGWTSFELVAGGRYRLGFVLPGLVWNELRAYGGSAARELRGIDAFVFLDADYVLAPNQDLRVAVKDACASTPSPLRASPAKLWTAAQCERVRGEPVATVLEHVGRRCDALAREALPLSKAFSSMSQRARDGVLTQPGELEDTAEKLARVDPPSACFTDNHLWNVDYTARASPLVLPKVQLDPAWKDGLERLGDWPR